MRVAHRDIIALYVIGILTAGIYFIWWAVQTKDEMNAMGAHIPSAWLILIPGGVFYWAYKYYEAFAIIVRKDGEVAFWFVLSLFFQIGMPALVQFELNRVADR